MALRQGIHLQAYLTGARHGQDGLRLVQDEAVRVVVDQEDAVLPCEGHQFFHHVAAGGGSGGHVGVIHPHELYAGKVHGIEGVEVRIPAVGGNQVVVQDLSLAHPGGRRIGGISGIGHQHFVAGIQEGQGQQEDALLGAHERLDFSVRVQGDAIPAGVPAGNGLAEFWNTGIALIAMGSGPTGTCRKRLHGLRGRGAVRRADSEVHHRVFPGSRPFSVEPGDFLVFDGEVIFLDGKGSSGGFNDHSSFYRAAFSPERAISAALLAVSSLCSE